MVDIALEGRWETGPFMTLPGLLGICWPSPCGELRFIMEAGRIKYCACALPSFLSFFFIFFFVEEASSSADLRRENC